MPLNPETQRIVDASNAMKASTQTAGGPPGPISPAQMREAAEGWIRPGPFEPVGAVHDIVVPGPAGDIPARVYVPEGAGPHPVVVWFHGGGWVIGSPEVEEPVCRSICRRAPAVIVSVDYRLAPENRFPAAAADAFAAVRWAYEHATEYSGDPERIAVLGISAGGNLAAVCALMARDAGGPRIAVQVLVSAVLGRPDDGRASYAQFGVGYYLDASAMEFFFTAYPRDAADLTNPYLVPLAADDLSGLAPALVMVAECDVLRDEGEEYARRLRAAGVDCQLVRWDGMVHGFFGLHDDQLSAAEDVHERIAAAIRAAH